MRPIDTPADAASLFADGLAAGPAVSAWEPSREAGLKRMAAFAPFMGGKYKSRRNYDLGPGERDGVSLLSPYIRRRLVTEREVASVALSAHSASACEKFVQEVFWRTYWKGWLEMRPSVWRAYRTGLADDRRRLSEDRPLRKRVEKAEAGATGLDCFDAWAQELVETGYLHNHTRMWFASIWVFTLGLPWRLGADFFLRHLLDGDAASNTLSWRWVAGLQTRGKNYVAAAWNIEKFTGGRFNPIAELADRPAPLVEAGPPPPLGDLRMAPAADPERPTALLLTEEDLSLETTGAPPALDIVAVGVLPLARLRSDEPVSERVEAFDAGAFLDAAARIGVASPETVSAAPGAIAEWARGAGATQVATGFAPQGWVLDHLEAARPSLAAADLRLAEIQRPWDATCWPATTAGFFKFKEKIPRFIAALGLR